MSTIIYSPSWRSRRVVCGKTSRLLTNLRALCGLALLAVFLIVPSRLSAQTNDNAWRDAARWDKIDEAGTADIHKYTTHPKYLTPLVSYIPDHPDVPSPRDVLGYTVGAEGKLTRVEDEYRYFETLAAASPRVALKTLGMTEEGRRMLLVIVADEETIANLDRYKAYTEALADPRKTNETEAKRIAAEAKPIMVINAGLHSPETGPPEMVMELAYRLAVSEHPDIKTIRDRVITMIIPVTEPDGRARTVDWYYRYLKDYDSRDYMPERSPPYWGAHAYHDNNRDGLQMTLKLTQHYIAMFHEWHPQYALDLHESVPLLYVSMGTGPYNEMVDPIAKTEWQWIANWEVAELNKHGLPGVWTWGFYTGWYPGYLMWIATNRNSLGRFYETFGNMVPKTVERDLSDNTDVAGNKITSEQWYRANPPDKKVMWSLRNNTNYMQSGVLASLTLLARNGETMLFNFWKKGYNSMTRGAQEPPYAWVIPADQPARDRVAYLLNQLGRHRIEVHQAAKDFKVEEGSFKKGDYVVRLDQPYGNFARNLLRVGKFPTDAKYRPYDDVSWTLGLVYRVETKEIKDKSILDMKDLKPVEEPVAFAGKMTGKGNKAYAVKHDGSNTLITLRYALKGFNVLAAGAGFEADGERFPAGSWIIPAQDGVQDKLREAAGKAMIDVYALSALPDVEAHEMDLPRLALYHNWVSTQSDGWVRYTLDQYGVDYDYINDDDIRQGGLRDRYDVILMAHQGGSGNLKAMIHGRDPKFGVRPYTKTAEFPSHGVIDSTPDITGGFGFQGLVHLERFLNEGGTLVLLGSAGVLATDAGLVRNVGTLNSGAVNTPGSNVQTRVVRRDHPIAYGYDDVHHVFRTNGPVYTVPEAFEHWIVVQYGVKSAPEDTANTNDRKGELLLTGFVSGQNRLERKGVVLDVPRHKGGRVVLYSFNPLHRYLNHGDFNYVFNAILHWNDFPDPEPKKHPKLAVD